MSEIALTIGGRHTAPRTHGRWRRGSSVFGAIVPRLVESGDFMFLIDRDDSSSTRWVFAGRASTCTGALTDVT